MLTSAINYGQCVRVLVLKKKKRKKKDRENIPSVGAAIVVQRRRKKFAAKTVLREPRSAILAPFLWRDTRNFYDSFNCPRRTDGRTRFSIIFRGAFYWLYFLRRFPFLRLTRRTVSHCFFPPVPAPSFSRALSLSPSSPSPHHPPDYLLYYSLLFTFLIVQKISLWTATAASTDSFCFPPYIGCNFIVAHCQENELFSLRKKKKSKNIILIVSDRRIRRKPNGAAKYYYIIHPLLLYAIAYILYSNIIAHARAYTYRYWLLTSEILNN